MLETIDSKLDNKYPIKIEFDGTTLTYEIEKDGTYNIFSQNILKKYIPIWDASIGKIHKKSSYVSYPPIVKYDRTGKEEKYGMIKKYVKQKFPNIEKKMICRDICCYHSDNDQSTAGLALSLGFTVYSWGNITDKMTPRNNLSVFDCRDVRNLLLGAIPSESSLGNSAELTFFDPCGFNVTYPVFVLNLAKHSKYTIWFISVSSCRIIGTYGKDPKYKLFDKLYPHGEGSLKETINIIIEQFNKELLFAEVIGRPKGIHYIIGIYNPSFLS